MDFLNEESPKPLKEPSDRAANFQKLQKQLKEFKNEMFSTRDMQNLKQKPFKKNSKEYLDKILGLMNIINKVDDLTNIEQLNKKLEDKKQQISLAREENLQKDNKIYEMS